jgi:DNA polymerase-4
MTGRAILHVDMDAFYVSVELLRRPELRGRPVVVGGGGPRGVVAAASYEARRYGVQSAMPSSVARRRCPDAVFLPGDHDRYAEVSTQVHEIFARFTPLVEPLALDEAFLDVTGVRRSRGDAAAIADAIRRSVHEELGLTCSVGVAPNKFLAKLASVAAKPVARPSGVEPGPGVVEVREGEELAFLHPLPVSRMWGVGPATLEKLRGLGVHTVGDLAELGEPTLVTALGRANGAHLSRLARGLDDRPVEPHRAPKSIGHEETFATDRHTHAELDRELVRLADGVAARLRRAGVGARTLTLKVRFVGFHTITRSSTGADPVDTTEAILRTLRPLLAQIDPTPGVRLLGVSGSQLAPPAEQLRLLDDDLGAPAPAADPARRGAVTAALDSIRERFGAAAIGPASTVEQGRLRVVRPGAQQWGPDGPPPPANEAGEPDRRDRPTR